MANQSSTSNLNPTTRNPQGKQQKIAEKKQQKTGATTNTPSTNKGPIQPNQWKSSPADKNCSTKDENCNASNRNA